MKTTAPAFPLYGGDWTKSTANMTADVRGHYIDLLIYSWDNDEPIPDDERILMQIARCTSPREWRRVWPLIKRRWFAVEGGFRNKRLEEERAKLKKKRQERSASGKAGAEVRWQGHSGEGGNSDGKQDGGAIANGAPDGWPSISSSGNSEPKDQAQNTAPTRELLALFDELHRARFQAPAHFNGKKDASILAALWRERGPAQTQALIRAFFALDDPWVAQRGFSVGILRTQVSKLLVRLAPSTAPVDEALGGADWFEECKRLHDGKCNGRSGHAIQLDIDAARATRSA